MDDWEPDVYDCDIDDVPEATRDYFAERAPDSISPMGLGEILDRIQPDSHIRYHSALHTLITDLLEGDEAVRAVQKVDNQHAALAAEYAFGVPTVEALDLLCSHAPVVELFAGNGYWAHEIERHGGTVHAYDASPPHDAWADVNTGTQDSLLHHAENDLGELALLLCWPPVGPAAYEALLVARPEHVFYVGERPCDGFKLMADEKFFQLLDARYDLETTVGLPSIPPAMDDLYHFTVA